jgi:hypothetical protein
MLARTPSKPAKSHLAALKLQLAPVHNKISGEIILRQPSKMDF